MTTGRDALDAETTPTFAWLVGREIRRIRRAADLSQEALAFQAGVHRTTIALYENGRRMPRLEPFVKIALALGVSPCELLPGPRP